jgi:hypothetical protein
VIARTPERSEGSGVCGIARRDLLPLGGARAVLGALFLLRTTPILAPLHIWYLESASPLLGWPDGMWHGAPVLVALPPVVVAALCVLRTVAAVLFMLGVFTRPAGVVAGAAGYLVLAQDPLGFLFTLHLLFLGTIVLGLAGGGAAFALRPDRAPPSEPARHAVWLLVASIYLWAGIGKLRGDWLDGRTLGVLAAEGAITGWPSSVLLATSTSRAVVACAVAATELALPAALLWRRSRRVAVAVALVMHTGIELTCRPDFLGWEMAALLIPFVRAPMRRPASVEPRPAG